MLTRLRALVAHILDCLRGEHDMILVTAPADSVYPFKHRCRFCLYWTPDDRVASAPRRPRG